MKNKYLELKEKHQKEINEFPMFFAFSQEQLTKGIENLNTTAEKCYSIGCGGFIRKTDSKKLTELFLRQAKEQQIAIEKDKTGEGFILDMFQYELDNHEYKYTMDARDTLDALGLTIDEISKSQPLLNGFRLAGGRYL